MSGSCEIVGAAPAADAIDKKNSRRVMALTQSAFI